MILDRLIRWILFCAGIITIIFAGYMFNIKRVDVGAAWLAVSVGLLCFATRMRQEKPEPSENNNNADTDNDLHDMAALIAELAISSLRNIGRTVPPGTKEIQDLEDKLNKFLDVMPLNQEERDEIADEFEKLRNRTRRNEGGRAIMRSARL